MTMTTVTGSKQYHSIVVPYHPRRTWLVLIIGGALLLGVAGLSFWLGGYAINKEFPRLKSENAELTAKLQKSESERQQISQEMANIVIGAEVDRKAVNEVRAMVREHQQIIAELNEEIGFYKGLMAPTEHEKGLSIRSWNVYATTDPQRFQFKLVIQQLAHKHSLLKGSLDVTLIGQVLGEEQKLPLSNLSGQAEHENIKLRFKYFQNIDGELQLPKGFEPLGIDVVARATTPKSVRIERHFGWIIQQ